VIDPGAVTTPGSETRHVLLPQQADVVGDASGLSEMVGHDLHGAAVAQGRNQVFDAAPVPGHR
jgi:hypothetical protein